MTDTPKVSAIIPTYNYGRFVCQAVDSVLAQAWPNVEVIVVDDGSTDDTADRLKSYADKIRYIYQTNRGLSAARNKCASGTEPRVFPCSRFGRIRATLRFDIGACKLPGCVDVYA